MKRVTYSIGTAVSTRMSYTGMRFPLGSLFRTFVLRSQKSKPRRSTFLVAALAVAVFFTNACGGGDKAQTVSSTEKPAATSPASATSAPQPTAPPTESVPTSEKLQALGLKLSDMPSGWSTSPPRDDSKSNTKFCNADPVGTKTPNAKADVSFEQSSFGPFVFDILATYSSGDAKQVMAAVATALTACTTWKETDAQGAVTNWRLSPLSFAKVGDETFAARMSTNDVPLFGSAQLDFVFWRRGNTVSSMVYAVIGPSANGNLLEDLTKKADSRLAENPFR